MEELDKDWINSGKLNEVRYYGMRPGKYIFKIKAANGSGVWSEKEIKINLIIHAPFWKAWWFYSLSGILLIVIVVLVTRYISQNRLKERIRKLEKQQAVNTERNRISKDMHDEIGSGLTRIALMTELMHTQQELDEKTKQDVNEIGSSTRQLVESMSEIIWTLNPHNDKLENLLAYLREQTQHYFEPLNVNYQISFPETVPDIKLSNEQRRNLFLVSKEALNNALKHSDASSIEFIANATEKKLKFSILDNGKGIDRTTKRAGANGLRNMQQRMNDIKGEIEWVSKNGNGTRVNYWINF
jgi:signal transduction histidine kinase